MHVIRMSGYSRILGQAAGLPPDEVDNLFHAAPMHGIGKIGIPDAVLLKQGPRTPEEWTTMRSHSQIAITHHEESDGSGYPHGLKGSSAIPIAGRIAAIADVFDALTSERPYKKAWTVEAPLAALFMVHLPEMLEAQTRWAETHVPKTVSAM